MIAPDAMLGQSSVNDEVRHGTTKIPRKLCADR